MRSSHGLTVTFLALLAASVVAACGGHPTLVPQPASTQVGAASSDAALGFRVVVWRRPLQLASAHAHLQMRPLVASPSPTPSPIADYAWISANPNYGEGFGLSTNDKNCKTIKWSYTTTIPSQDVSYYFSPPTTAPNQTTNLSMAQTAPIPPKVYNQTISAVCNDGKGPTPRPNSIAVVQLDWYDTIAKKTVTNTTQTAVVGAPINLAITTTPSTYVVPIPQDAPYNIWSWDGTSAAGSYVQTYASGSFADPDVGVNPSLYWLFSDVTGNYGNPSVVYVLAEVLGNIQPDYVYKFQGTGSVPVTYHVLGPTNVSMTAQAGPVLVGPYPNPASTPGLSLGIPPTSQCPVPPGNPPPGMLYKLQAQAPTGPSGWISAIQLISITATMTPKTGASPVPTQPPSTNGFVLDSYGSVFYGNYRDKVNAGQTKQWCLSDSPVTFLDPDWASYTRSDQFKDWFVYEPNVANSIWVPIGYITWSWGGSTTQNTNGTWAPPYNVTNPNPVFQYPLPYAQVPFPTWNGHYP